MEGVMSWEDDMDLMEEDYVFDGWREGQEYYDSANESEVEGVVMTNTALKEVTYTRKGNSDEWDVEVHNEYPIISINGNIVKASDNEGGTFTARVSKDRMWNKTHLGEPVNIRIISQN